MNTPHVIRSNKISEIREALQIAKLADSTALAAAYEKISLSETRSAQFFSVLSVARWLAQGGATSDSVIKCELEQFQYLAWYCFKRPKEQLRWVDVQDIEAIITSLANTEVMPTSFNSLSVTALMITAYFAVHGQGVVASDIEDGDALIKWFCIEGARHLGITRFFSPQQKVALYQPIKIAGGVTQLPLIVKWIWEVRTDLRAAIDITQQDGVKALGLWFGHYGIWEHQLTHLFMSHNYESISIKLCTLESNNLPEFLSSSIAEMGGGTTLRERINELRRKRYFWPEILGQRGAKVSTFLNRSDEFYQNNTCFLASNPDANLAASRYLIKSGQRVYFISGSSAAGLLVDGGWNEPEHTHTWSRKPFSSIGFALDSEAADAPDNPTHIKIELDVCYLHSVAQEHQVSLAITLDDAVMDYINLRDIKMSDGFEPIIIIAPYRREVRMLGFIVDKIFSPRDYGSHDARDIGMGIRSMVVQWC